MVYPTGTVMIDSGMDQAVHRFFGFGREEPYWPERNAAVQEALKQAKLIVVTHEHGDHVAGVIRSDSRKEIAAKTLLTREQVRTLLLYPQMPEIRLTPEAARDYIVVDYESYLPVAPGLVLIKAPGHTPGHQMVYVRLEFGTRVPLHRRRRLDARQRDAAQVAARGDDAAHQRGCRPRSGTSCAGSGK